MLIENAWIYGEDLMLLLKLLGKLLGDPLVYVQVGKDAPVLLTKITTQNGNIILMGKEEPCEG